jgi:response regulator RpfG family c-di-GMP phosphodiesterase
MYKDSELGHASRSKSNAKVLHHASVITLEHHEKWDGNSYSRGIKDEEIMVIRSIYPGDGEK